MAASSDALFSFYSRGNKNAEARTPELLVPRRSSRLRSPLSPCENVDVTPVQSGRKPNPQVTPTSDKLSRRLDRLAFTDRTNDGSLTPKQTPNQTPNQTRKQTPKQRPTPRLTPTQAPQLSPRLTPKRLSPRLSPVSKSKPSVDLCQPWMQHPAIDWGQIIRDVAPDKLKPKSPACDEDVWREAANQFEVDDLYRLCMRAGIWQLIPVQEVKNMKCVDADDAKHGAFASVCPVTLDGQLYVAKVCGLDPEHNPVLDVVEEFLTMARIPPHSNVVRASFLAFDYNPTAARGAPRCRAVMLLERCNAALQDVMQPYFKNALKAKGLYNEFVARVAYASAKGCAYLHDKCGLLHCDIKEANILLKWPKIFTLQQFMTRLTEEPVLMQLMGVKIGDFGLSLSVNEGGTFTYYSERGTHGYIAPECVDNEEVFQLLDKRLQQKVKALAARESLTSKADIFAWGVTMHHLTEFAMPEEVSKVQRLAQHNQQAGNKKARAPNPELHSLKAKAQAQMLLTCQDSKLDPDLHAEIACVIQKCMSLEPEKRPSWKEIQEVLERHVPL